MATIENHLLAGLPARDRRRLLLLATAMPLDLSSVLVSAGETPAYVYFPTRGFVSLVSSSEGNPSLEVGMVGTEGMVGTQVVLGVVEAPLRALVQGAGSALRIPIKPFRGELDSCKALKEVMDRYIHVLNLQLMTSLTCVRFHQVAPRLARWLLMSQDRAHSNQFSVTQEFMAYMLGARRSGISEAATLLQRDGLISYKRGEMTVLDRPGLEAVSCSCYLADLQCYARSLGSVSVQSKGTK
ncbi:Crp/Fnr family transcriptional regulator [Variovorax sp. J22R24]|uniref:Crp/Fnr family transcriptional regulator n=1 Tax=Variovorax gracilis TaxID=3053502 RepID=UPI00257683FE|nr:Crp/Fnr family transcriptional regulator [Variovorax sp. J22R24]MDM0109309.1 Crp/Fnr family transcriptional regulator [Variovorax sp. J22R24]